MPLPFEVTVWLLAAGVSSFRLPSCDWECKGKRILLTDKQKRKLLFFFVSLFNPFPPPVEAGCKGKALFRLSQALSNFNFRRLLRSGTAGNTSTASVKFLTDQLSVGAVALAEPVVRLTIWDCKSRGIFWVYKMWCED
ncbi:hypothetical protein [Hymenobacter segetis]